MDPAAIKSGDIFYYEDHIPHLNKRYARKCRVLFVGEEHIFYDAWWNETEKWTFVPVRKRLTFYRYPFAYLHQLTFDGFEKIDDNIADRLFLHLPEILLRIAKNEIAAAQSDNTLIHLETDKLCFVPVGPKGGWLKPVLFDTANMTRAHLMGKVIENQNFDLITIENIIIDRIGLHYGVPSYTVRPE